VSVDALRRHRRRPRPRAARQEGVAAAPTALRIGAHAAAALAPEVAGRIVATQRAAVIVLLDERCVVAILPPRSPLHPWALTAALDPAGLSLGAPAHIRPGELELGGQRVSFGGAALADLRLTWRPSRPPRELVGVIARLAGELPPVCSLVDEITSRLEEFRSGGDPARLTGLVGLGDGYTPAGDDVICGVLAGLDALQQACPSAAALRASLAASLPAPLERLTTRLSAQLLRAAVDGHYAEPILGLLHALAGLPPGPAAAARAAASLCALGHSSGRCIHAGIVAAIQRLARRRAG
jgi:hypothetical protein